MHCIVSGGGYASSNALEEAVATAEYDADNAASTPLKDRFGALLFGVQYKGGERLFTGGPARASICQGGWL